MDVEAGSGESRVTGQVIQRVHAVSGSIVRLFVRTPGAAARNDGVFMGDFGDGEAQIGPVLTEVALVLAAGLSATLRRKTTVNPTVRDRINGAQKASNGDL